MNARAAVPATATPDEREARFSRVFVTPEGVDLRLTLGSAGERAAAFLLDLLLMGLALIVLTLLSIWLAASAGRSGFEPVAIIWLLGAFILRSGWFVLFELTPRAATPGKRALGLRVAARDGGRLTSEAVFVRNAMREIEVFLPMVFLFAAQAAGDAVDAWLVLVALTWTGVFLFFPLFNRDRLRAGDFVAGTWVVKSPRRRLDIDLTGAARSEGEFAFTLDQVGAYGVKELQVLEDVLRRRDKRTLAAVADRIRAKIGWRAAPGETDADFLMAYYAALRRRLEHRLLFGRRRRDKFDAP